jgi:hypothetical protein
LISCLSSNKHFCAFGIKSNSAAFESFVQFQKDKVSFINYRTLVGLGTRFKVHQSEKNSFYIGALLMYEYENSVGVNNNVI